MKFLHLLTLKMMTFRGTKSCIRWRDNCCAKLPKTYKFQDAGCPSSPLFPADLDEVYLHALLGAFSIIPGRYSKQHPEGLKLPVTHVLCHTHGRLKKTKLVVYFFHGLSTASPRSLSILELSVTCLFGQFSRPGFTNGRNPFVLLLMAEILHHLRCRKPCK